MRNAAPTRGGAGASGMISGSPLATTGIGCAGRCLTAVTSASCCDGSAAGCARRHALGRRSCAARPLSSGTRDRRTDWPAAPSRRALRLLGGAACDVARRRRGSCAERVLERTAPSRRAWARRSREARRVAAGAPESDESHARRLATSYDAARGESAATAVAGSGRRPHARAYRRSCDSSAATRARSSLSSRSRRSVRFVTSSKCSGLSSPTVARSSASARLVAMLGFVGVERRQPVHERALGSCSAVRCVPNSSTTRCSRAP